MLQMAEDNELSLYYLNKYRLNSGKPECIIKLSCILTRVETRGDILHICCYNLKG